MSGSELVIAVHDLDAGGKHVVFALRPAFLRGLLEGHDATPTGAEGLLDVRVSKTGSDVVVHGRLRAELEAPCARCLEPARVLVDKNIAALAVKGPVAAPKTKGNGAEGAEIEYELAADEADIVTFDGETLVLDDLVRDELILETPMIPLCSESCPGIRPTLPEEGAEASRSSALDPRLAPLLRFKKKE